MIEDLQRRVRAVLDDMAGQELIPTDVLRLIDAVTDLAAEKTARRLAELLADQPR